ncbi:hypothetical protein QGN29_12140 [Temperatibacter marinus]|uniref:Uncharacterized protein n=1 Tax=Temperatibacter marinus TaxID=1456591 RepID=A0AA52EFS5_9PROT|nr:hypothetical protein [Temperatibacter marinus]WND02298.1 hypothetical protein QGN29_12140 [Temperatibacter marinus]
MVWEQIFGSLIAIGLLSWLARALYKPKSITSEALLAHIDIHPELNQKEYDFFIDENGHYALLFNKESEALIILKMLGDHFAMHSLDQVKESQVIIEGQVITLMTESYTFPTMKAPFSDHDIGKIRSLLINRLDHPHVLSADGSIHSEES